MASSPHQVLTMPATPSRIQLATSSMPQPVHTFPVRAGPPARGYPATPPPVYTVPPPRMPTGTPLARSQAGTIPAGPWGPWSPASSNGLTSSVASSPQGPDPYPPSQYILTPTRSTAYHLQYSPATPAPPRAATSLPPTPASASRSRSAPRPPSTQPLRPAPSLRDIAGQLPKAVTAQAPGKVVSFGEGDADCLEIFCGEHPFDALRALKEDQMPQSTVALTYTQLRALWRSRAYEGAPPAIQEHLARHGLLREARLLARVFRDPAFAQRTALSIECCSAVLDMDSNHMQPLREFVEALLQVGANVAVADFALEAVNRLFCNALPPVFQGVRRDVDGTLSLHFNNELLAAAPNGQIASLGRLAEAGNATIHAMGSTRRPILHPQAQSFIRVLAVAEMVGRERLAPADLVRINPATGAWQPLTAGPPPADSKSLSGIPTVMVVDPASAEYRRTGWTGHLLLFVAHFADLVEVRGVTETRLFEVMEQTEDRGAVESFRAAYIASPEALRPQLLQQQAVRSISYSSSSSPAYYSRPSQGA